MRPILYEKFKFQEKNTKEKYRTHVQTFTRVMVEDESVAYNLLSPLCLDKQITTKNLSSRL